MSCPSRSVSAAARERQRASNTSLRLAVKTCFYGSHKLPGLLAPEQC
jgi:hypothetical protein